MNSRQAATDYQRIADAIAWLRTHAGQQPTLAAIAAAMGLTPAHCQRLFRRWAGVSPQRFLALLTVGHAQALLDRSSSVLEVALETGLSGPGRLHDRFVAVTAMSPGEARRGEGLTIRHGRHDSPAGRLFIAATSRGICRLSFLDLEQPEDPAEALRRRWPAATLLPDDAGTAELARRVFARAPDGSGPLTLFVAGTNFQLQVWQALLRIPPGTVTSYAALAAATGRPRATRAVGTAVGANPVAWVIPCHRVLRAGGELGGYRWGTTRKQLLLAREWGAAEQPVASR
jgi:AraC family transcriptional regulator, regulatory protein of adaptative response / methylated-DNA-[protein]-cysteine methyltransferase